MAAEKKKRRSITDHPLFPLISVIFSGILVGTTAYIAYTEQRLMYVFLCGLWIYFLISAIFKKKTGQQKQEEHTDRYCVQIYTNGAKKTVAKQIFFNSFESGVQWVKKHNIRDGHWDIFDTMTGEVATKKKA